MTAEKHVGNLVDTTGAEAEIWLDTDCDHLFIMIGGSQVGDFPVGKPLLGDPEQQAAEFVYREYKRHQRLVDVHLVSPDDDDYPLIESFDTPEHHYHVRYHG